jgi:metallo-beta-lactamase family protein
VFLDSPMAVDATDIYKKHAGLLDADTQVMLRSGQNPFRFPGMKFVQTVEESRAINNVRMPSIIMAGSGMCTGGRIKHHLSQHLSRQECTILFVGYQAAGTLGREILDGGSPVRIHGRMHQVKARVERLTGLSAHADRSTLMRWLGLFETPPKQLFLTHGEASAAMSLAENIRQSLGWTVDVPEYLATVPFTESSEVSSLPV